MSNVLTTLVSAIIVSTTSLREAFIRKNRKKFGALPNPAHWALEAGYIRLKGDIVFKSPISSGRG